MRCQSLAKTLPVLQHSALIPAKLLPTMLNIAIQTEDFNHDQLYQALRANSCTGAVVTFTGLVRDFSEQPGHSCQPTERTPASG